MLVGIDPRLSPELLHTLASMGHGDRIAVVDRNYPATRAGVAIIRLVGCDLLNALEAISSVLPLDTKFPPWVEIMVSTTGRREIHHAALTVLGAVGAAVADRSRDEFYERARGCAAIVQTGEPLAYGNVALAKGAL